MKVIVFLLAAATAASASSRTIWPWHKSEPVTGCTEPVKNVKITTTGEIIEGPACVAATVNALRYNNVIHRTVTEVQGPDLFGALSKPPGPIKVEDIPEATPPKQDQQKAQQQANDSRSQLHAQMMSRAISPVEEVERSFGAVQKVVDSTDVLLAVQQSQIRTAKSNTNQYLLTIKTVVVSSDSVLQGGAPSLIASSKKAIENIKPITWPNVEDTLAGINKSLQDLNALQEMAGWADWSNNPGNSKRYDAVKQRATTQKTAAEGMTTDTDAYKTLSQQVAVIQQWIEFINALTPGMFQATEDVSCGALFNLTRNNTLQLSQTDRLPTLDLKDPATTNIDNWVVVRCSTPFSVSAGIIFSFVADNEFGIVASKGAPDMSGNPTTVNKFQRTATSDIPKLPIALAHVRIWETQNKEFAFHGSFGVAAHSRSSSQGGSDPEYLFGGSLSLWRTMFITGGPYWATRVNLGGGFAEGDIVPSGVNSPPLVKQGVRGWALAISFTKP